MYIIYATISDRVHANTISLANTVSISTLILKLTINPSLFHRDNSLDYLEFRLWIGLWSAIFCLVLVATDASFLVQYFTRFTEEGFSALISFIFIYDAFKKMIKLGHYNPINANYDTNLVTQYDCRCMPGMWSSHGWTGHVKMVHLSHLHSLQDGQCLIPTFSNLKPSVASKLVFVDYFRVPSETRQ